jgi:hypothetical protein
MTIDVRTMIQFFDLLGTPDEVSWRGSRALMGRVLSIYKRFSVGPRNLATGKQTLTMNRGQGDRDETKNYRYSGGKKL